MKKRYFVLSALFLFNPLVSIFDIFPDFIGYFLLMKAFSDASYVYDNASETHDALKKMGIISVIKVVCLIILPNTDATMALVFSFTFAILEVMYGIGAFQKLFDTTSFICLRCDEDRFVAKSEGLKKFTIGFFITRIVCATVPDLFTLFLSDPQNAWKARFRTLAFVFAVALALIVGIIWFVRFVSFFKKTLTDDVNSKIKSAFVEEMKDRQTVFFSKDFIFAIGILLISMIFAIDFSVDNVDLLFDFILAPLVLIAYKFLSKKGHIGKGKWEKLLVISSVLHFVVSVANVVFNARFFKIHISTSTLRAESARADYLPVRILTAVESIAFVVIAILILHLIRKYATERIKENPRFFSEYSIDGFLNDFSKITLNKVKLSSVLAIVYAVSSIAYTIVVPYRESYVVFNTFVAILFYISFIHTLSYISDEIFKKILKYS